VAESVRHFTCEHPAQDLNVLISQWYLSKESDRRKFLLKLLLDFAQMMMPFKYTAVPSIAGDGLIARNYT
jgi:hypothetical protein